MNLAPLTDGILDTSAVIAMMRKRVVTPRGVAITFITYAELQSGVQGGRDSFAESQRIERTLGDYTILHPTNTTMVLYAKLFTGLAAMGQLIPSNDIWTAAIAIELDVPLYGKDKHFDRVPGLKYINISTLID